MDSLKDEMKKKEDSGNKEKEIYNVDVSELEVGDVIKNYKILCELLKQPRKAGDAKKAQLKEFKRYFDWEKSGQKFIITDVYETPLDKDDNRKFGNNSIYVKYIEVILLRYLSTQQGYTRTLTKRKWWELLGIVNKKYDNVPYGKLKELNYIVTSWQIKHFYQRCNKKLDQILYAALNSLKSRKLIMYEIQTIIVERDKNNKEVYFEADDDDKKKILDVESYVLHNIFQYDKIIQVFLKFQQREYYDKVNELLGKHYGWDHCFKQIKIIYTPNGVRQVYPELEAKVQKELTMMLNEKVQDAIEKNAQNIYSTWKEKSRERRHLLGGETESEKYWGKPNFISSSSVKEEPPATYLEAQTLLKDELIKIGHENMKFSAKDFLESNEELNLLFDFEK